MHVADSFPYVGKNTHSNPLKPTGEDKPDSSRPGVFAVEPFKSLQHMLRACAGVAVGARSDRIRWGRSFHSPQRGEAVAHREDSMS
jgi:hypothetical protein